MDILSINTNTNETPFRWFLAIVKANDDPLQLGRVRVSVIGHHDQSSDIQDEDLPWAIPLIPTTSESIKGTGISPTGLSVGATVLGFYLDHRNKRMPMILGSYMKIPDGDASNHEVPDLARGISSIHKELVGPEPENPYAATYPYNKVTKTAGGIVVELDDTPGSKRVHIYHPSGSYIEIQPNGDLVTKSVNDGYEIIVKDKQLYVGGNITVHIGGSASINVQGDVDITASGSVTGNSNGLEWNV